MKSITADVVQFRAYVNSTFYFLKRKNTNVEKTSLNFHQIFFLELNYKIIEPKKKKDV